MIRRMYNEFKEFAMKGSVVDLAVGIVIGGAFGKMVTSLVDDIIMPPLGLFIRNVDFSNLFINLSSVSYSSLAEAQKAGAPTINYGIFINHVLNFAIVAFSMFFVVRQINHFKRRKEKSETSKKSCPYCFHAIPTEAVKCGFCTSNLK